MSRCSLLHGALAFVCAVSLTNGLSGVDAAQESAAVRLLKGGKVPPERQGAVLEMIGRRGTSADLAFVFERLNTQDGFEPAPRKQALRALVQAARDRGLKPDGDTSALLGWLKDERWDSDCRAAAARLAGHWGMASASDTLAEFVAQSSSQDLKRAAVDALVDLASAGGKPALESLARADQPRSTRLLALSGLARLDPASTADQAAEWLASLHGDEDATVLLGAFLNRQGGADELARAIAARSLSSDAAKLVLRGVYTLGRSDAALVAALSAAAGLDADPRPWSEEEMAAFVADVRAHGNPERGEAVFRRADLNCMGCHRVAGVGGTIGPDLSPIGTSSPPDYLVRAVLLPDEAIKEQYNTLVVLTDDGEIFQGIVVDRDDQRIVLKEANGTLRTVPVHRIEDQREGGSLMPRGLAALMTREEFVDLIAFLSELGKPGPYAIRTTPSVQRWDVLKDVPAELVSRIPDTALLRSEGLALDAARWVPAFARVSGELQLHEWTRVAGSEVIYLRTALDVTEPGNLKIDFASDEGLAVWIDGERVLLQGHALTAELGAGRRELVIRVDTSTRTLRSLRADLHKPPGSTIQFTPVDVP